MQFLDLVDRTASERRAVVGRYFRNPLPALPTRLAAPRNADSVPRERHQLPVFAKDKRRRKTKV